MAKKYAAATAIHIQIGNVFLKGKPVSRADTAKGDKVNAKHANNKSDNLSFTILPLLTAGYYYWPSFFFFQKKLRYVFRSSFCFPR